MTGLGSPPHQADGHVIRARVGYLLQVAGGAAGGLDGDAVRHGPNRTMCG